MMETMENESWGNGNIAQRNLHMLNFELMADCTFVVGRTEKKKFKCHKCVLSEGSPVFYVMFNRGLEEKGEVKVEDIEPQYFRKMLEFIYSDNTELENVESALNICYAASKYMINTLKLKCIQFIKKNLNVDTVCKSLEFARLVDDSDLEAKSMRYLQLHTSDVLKSASFPYVKKATLLTILNQDDLYITTELEVFSACVRWAKAQGGGEGKLREVLGPEILSLIRFLTMTAKQFVINVVPSNLLEVQEERDILCCITVGTRIMSMPQGFNDNIKNRSAFEPRETIKILAYTTDSCTGQALNSFLVTFSVNVESFICGFQLHGISYSNKTKIVTDDNFSVNLFLDTEMLASAEFKGLMSHGETVEVNFNTPCLLKANTKYTLQMRYSKLNTSYTTYKLYDDVYITTAGVKLNVDFKHTTITKIYVTKKSFK